MSLIEVRDLVKEFQVFDRRDGVRGALHDLVSRRYRPLRAVDGVTFDVGLGEIVGYIGPNGAGKSTTIKMLTGILVPSGGHLQVDGLLPHRDRQVFTRRIGVVFGQRTQLWWDIAVIESFRLLAKIYGLTPQDLDRRIDELDPILDLKPLLRTPVRKLSLGQRMRCDLGASLLHAPPILFLDEPTIGLDVVAKDAIRAFLKEINQQFKTTVLLTTHDLRDIEELCRRVIVIDHGRILFDGALSDMKARHSGRVHVEIETSVEVDRASIARLPGVEAGAVTMEVMTSHRFRASFERKVMRPADLIRAVMRDTDVAEVSIEEASIEEVVKRIYQGDAGAAGKASTAREADGVPRG